MISIANVFRKYSYKHISPKLYIWQEAGKWVYNFFVFNYLFYSSGNLPTLRDKLNITVIELLNDFAHF